jgi:hypothetical protein
MPLADVDIANRALLAVGASRISSLQDDSEAALSIAGYLDGWRTNFISASGNCNWSWAKGRAELPALAEAPAWGFKYAYQVPSDFLTLISLGQYGPYPNISNVRGRDDGEWSIEGERILCSYAPPLKIRYLRDVPDYSIWGSNCVEAFCLYIASQICERLTQSNSKKQLIMADYQQALIAAAMDDSKQNPPQDIPDNSWITSRFGY